MIKTKFSSSLLSILLITTLNIANAQTANIHQSTLTESNATTQEISTEQLRELLKGSETVVFDARPHLEYSISHIPDAINVSAKPGVSKSMYVSDVAEIGRQVKENHDAPIIIYCNGPFCGKAKRLGSELLEAGYTNVQRYQLGIPVWRALGEITETGLDGAKYIYAQDKTAVWIDARDASTYAKDSLPEAKNIDAASILPGKDVGDVKTAKDDGRLPMHDHNTRIIVFADDIEQAKTVANALAKEAFHNVSYFDGNYQQLKQGLEQL